MIRIRLSEKDRETYGCTEWIELDLDKLMVQEAIELDEAGIDHERALAGKPVLDDEGKPVTNPETGMPLRVWGSAAFQVWVWLALRRAGRGVPIADLDFDIYGADLILPNAVPPPSAVEPGKARGTRRSPAKRARSSRTSIPG